MKGGIRMKKKIIVVRQRDVNDCGPCTLQSIIRYYNGYVSLEKIRMDTYTSNEGTTVYHLLNAAKKYGFDAVAKKNIVLNTNKIILPAIVHVKYDNGMTHFMCLYEINKDNVVVMDPASGKVKMSFNEFANIFSGIVIELFPKQKILFLEKESSIYNLFFKIVKANKNLCINILLCSILLTIFTIFSGLYFKISYELIGDGHDIKSYYYIIYIFLVILLFKILFDFLKKYYENHLNKNIDVNIFSSFINHIFNLPLSVINTRSSGEIISRVNEIGNVKELFSDIFVSCFLDLILSGASIVMLFYINYKLALILCLFIIIYIIVNVIISPHLYKRIRQNLDYQTIFNSILIDNVELINSIKNLDEVHNTQISVEDKLSNLIYDNYEFTTQLNAFSILKNFISEIMLFLVNTYGFYLIYTQNLSLVSLVIFNTLMVYFIDPIKNIVSLIPKFIFLRASFNKICDFVDLNEENMGMEETFINGDICFKQVNFTYDSYSKIINDFNLVIRKGEKIMIKGDSGSGKSTICNLLKRTYNPSGGEILIDYKNILDYSIKTIRKNIVYVGQKERLLTDTIEKNILFYKEKNKLFDKACSVCLINDIVKKRALRFQFGINNNSSNISGGEKQRIILARALAYNSKILILDEALSETDYEMEKSIINNIIKEYPGQTLIYISHKNQDKLFNRVITLRGNNEY